MSRPIVVVHNETPMVMEVIGEDGQKVRDFAITNEKNNGTGKHTRPYYQITGSMSL